VINLLHSCAIKHCLLLHLPASETGIVKWMRENLFSSLTNSILTLAALYAIYSILSGSMPWILGGIWQAPSLQACREILAGDSAGCFAVLTERWHQLVFGFKYPQEAYWRPTLAFVLLIVAVAPVLFANLPRRMLILTGLYPFIGFWLIWGGTIMSPFMGLVGFIVAYMVFQRLERSSFAIGALGGLIAAIIVWTIGGYVSDAMSGFLALEQIPSRDMGGFMLNIILGTVCVSLSLPIGILLALGRQSNMPIIKIICVVFIEFIRGVPLITLLFVANVVLAYFLPPGTTFDLILRVIIMITMFSSAYIAEVIRGGLAALPRGQYEAGDSLGLDYAQSMRLIILP
jgi:general L-amino acid transport system permease protein